MKRSLVASLFLLLLSMFARGAEHDSVLVYIGTHGIERPSEEQIGPHGIYAARLNTATGKLSPLGLQVELQRATWLTPHPRLPIIYTVANAAGGMAVNSNIHAFALDGVTGKLREVGKVDAGGRDATHLDFDAASSTLFSANHGSGSVTALPISGDGSVGPVASSQSDYGNGPHRRQKKPAAHGVAVDPSHRYVLVADFSADRIFVYRFDPATRALTPAETPFEATPAGSGPRHLAFHPNGKFLYLTTELTAELRTYRWDAQRGRLQLVNAFSAYPAGYSGTADRSAAEVVLSRDGRFLYVSLRGDQDSIVGYEVDDATGTLQEMQRVASQGKTPWSFAIDPTGRWMLVTNEASNSVNVLAVDPVSGKLSATQESLRIPKPLTVTFYRR